MARGERPTKIGYSWFSAKSISVERMMSMARGRALNGLGWPPFRFTNPRETPNTGLDRLYRQTFWVLRSKVERETAQIVR